MGYLVIFGFFVYGRKWIFIFIFILFFAFVPKMSFALDRKCYVRNWAVTKFCDIGTVTFVFVFFRPKMEFHFRRHFRLRPKMKNAFSVGLWIKLFQITPYVNDFQTLNNPGSGQPVGASKISFTLHFLHKAYILHRHHHHHHRRRRHRVVRVTVAPLHERWRSHISTA